MTNDDHNMLAPSLEAVLGVLERRTAELNADLDALSRAFEALEDRLVELGAGVPAWVEAEGGAWRFGFDQIDGRWRLVVACMKRTSGGEPYLAESMPLVGAGRTVRLACAHLVEPLCQRLLTDVADLCGRAELARRAAAHATLDSAIRAT